MSGGVQSMSIEDVSNWLLRKGFPVAIADAFRGEFFLVLFLILTAYSDQAMDGEALAEMYVTTPGPVCLKDVLSCKHGLQLKIYKAVKSLMEVSCHNCI